MKLRWKRSRKCNNVEIEFILVPNIDEHSSSGTPYSYDLINVRKYSIYMR